MHTQLDLLDTVVADGRRDDRRHTNRRLDETTARVAIKLLGGFEVSVNGAVIPEADWRRRTAASLVKILALAPARRLHREQVMELLWPNEPPRDAAPKLHKAAHYARKAAGGDAVVLRNDVALLFPASDLTVDVAVFDELSQRAIADGDPAAARAAIARYAGELLPDDRYEEWAAERRELLRLRHLNLLRLAGRWIELTELEPSDEDAHLELMRRHVANGDCTTALLQYQRMERILNRDLGVTPGVAVRELRDHCESTTRSTPHVGSRPCGTIADCPPPAVGVPTHNVEALVAELAELTRRQAMLLKALVGAPIWPPPAIPAAS
jgi:DNA-binding SARP family transcriptional activator